MRLIIKTIDLSEDCYSRRVVNVDSLEEAKDIAYETASQWCDADVVDIEVMEDNTILATIVIGA
jgi:hypothetical protein